MEISVTLDEFDFDLDIDIITYPSYRPATRNHPEEGEDAEFNIESIVPSGFNKVTFGEWNSMNYHEQEYYVYAHEESDRITHEYCTDEESEIILEAIEKELVLEAKYAMEP